jgi:aspartate aminotransferase
LHSFVCKERNRMNVIAQRVGQLGEMATLAMARKARELSQAGKPVVSLTLGEPDFNIPAPIQEAAHEAIRNNFSHYPPLGGYPELKAAIARKLLQDNNLSYKPEQILASTGAKQVLANLLMAIINPGDEVLLPTPFWVAYEHMVLVAGGVPVRIAGRAENNFKLQADALASHITAKTKVLMYSNPGNPAGHVYSAAELEPLAAVLRLHPQVLVISDEIYEYIHYGEYPASMAALDGMYDRTITVNGLSKAFAMTGWRIGYGAGPADIIKAAEQIQGVFTSAPNAIAQQAARAALDLGRPLVQPMVNTFEQRRGLVTELAQTIPGTSFGQVEGAFYLLLNVKDWINRGVFKSSAEICSRMLDDIFVATVPGEAFGTPGYLRFSFAAAEADLREGFERTRTFFAAHS